MKSIFLKVCSFLFFASAALVNAQVLHTVELDKDLGNFSWDYVLVVSPADSVKFISVNGEFAISISDANALFENVDPKLNIKVNNPTPESDTYVVVSTDNYKEAKYSIYCITDNSWPDSWPDAPPKIIILVN